MIPIAIFIAFILGLILSVLRVLREYERGVVFMLGRFWKVKGPGLIIIIPVLQQWVRLDLRVIVHDVPTQDVISRDNVSVKVNAVIYFRVIDPQKAIINVEDFFFGQQASWRKPRYGACSVSMSWMRCWPNAIN